MGFSPRTIPPRAIVHQEGVFALVALVGLALRDGSPLAGLAPRGSWGPSLGWGVVVGVGLAGGLWAVELAGGLRGTVRVQRLLVEGWKPADGLAVAAISGVAEEALVRALLQPLIGLVPAAGLFGLLHVVPDRRAWGWPVLAFVLGLVLGLVFRRWGWPAAAVAHVTVNAAGLYRLSRLPS